MPRTAKAKRIKSANGVGDVVVVNFDVSDPNERRALEAARLLASKHGRRKAAILALLEAVLDRYEATGQVMTPTQIAAALSGQGQPVQRPQIGFTVAKGQPISTAPASNFSTSQVAERVKVEVIEEKPDAINWHEKMHNAASGWGFFDQ